MKKEARHSLVETVTMNKQIGAQMPLIVRDKQQLLTTINKQKHIISVFVSRQLRQIWTFGGGGNSPVVFTLRKDLGQLS
jgi:hypothetical protein